jgi:hypothetical protein
MSELRELLNQAGIPIKDTGNNVGRLFINICCPHCNETLFHCGIHESELFYKCLVCAEGGSWYKLRRVLEKQYPRVDWSSINTGKYKPRYVETASTYLPKELQELTRPLTKKDERQFDYLTEIPFEDELGDKFRPRGLEPSLITRINPGIGINKLKGYVTFTQGQNLIARSYVRSKARWWKSVHDGVYIYGADFVEEVQPQWVAITEGVFDCLSVPFGHGLAILGSMTSTGWISKLVESVPKKTKTVLLALDKGVPANTRNKFALILNDCGLDVYSWNWNNPDFDDIKDIDEVRLIYGRKFVTTHCEQIVGIKAKDEDFLESNFL